MKPPTLKLIVIRTTDVPRLVAFYRCLGIEFTEHRHGAGPMHFASDLCGIVFEIYPTKKLENVDRSTRLGFSVSDIRTAIISTRELGSTTVEELLESPWELRAVVRNPDGRSVEFYSDDPTT